MEKQKGNRSMVSKVETKDQWELLFNMAQNKAYPMVVHFGATWCVPSVAMNPVFEELASTYSHVMFIFVDVDEVKEVASKFEVKAMPTFILMNDGVAIDKLVGANPDEIKKRVEIFIQSDGTNIA
ncbi:thioredoxin-like protein CXXS1 [Amaranthus tricolor]|uniref:thioredoxin-like protein CXXS1 n=1 Tax=Amaranthus tricolor TaxID=29722 RepID=UPI00258F5148|nr:thioredoxin-like protein CXXS1 [Amaranthus tricolor]